jgi:ATP-dependent helicase/nuclease subunit B
LSIQFIAGNSGSGKSHYIYEKIIQESLRHPERKYLILVPEQFTLSTEKQLAMLHPRKAILNINVLSFQRLSWRVFGEVGGNSRPVLEETGKSLVLQKIAWDNRKKLKILGATLQKPGAVSQMKSLISELLQYRIRPEDLDSWTGGQEGKKLLELKLQDVQAVYRGFSDYLSSRYLTAEELPEVLCSVIGKSSLIRNSTVVLDGFMGFTPVQLQVIRQLCSLCERLFVVVTADPREDLFRKDMPHRLFHVSGQMIRQITEIAKETGTEVLPADWVLPGPESRLAANPVLHFLEQNLFRYGKRTWKGQQDRVMVGEAESPAEELDCTAETILRLVREKGYRYRDFAVVTGDLPAYGREAEKAFRQAGIPFFLDQKYDVMMNPLVEFIRAAVDMAVQNCSYESVFRFLRCGLADFSEEETDRLENYVLALGIRSRKQYEERWVRISRGMKPEDMEPLNALRERFCTDTGEFLDAVKTRMSTAGQKTEALYRLIVRHDIQRKLKEREEALQAEGEAARAKEYAQIYRIVMDLLDKTVEVLGGEKMGLTAYQQILEAGFQETSVGLIPPGGDQVLVGDMERTRLKNVRVLFLLGVNEGIIPKRVAKGGILSEADREYLKERKITLSPTAREEMYRQRFYLYLSLSKPSDQLYLFYSRTDFSGGTRMPSYLIGTLLRLFPALKVLSLQQERTVCGRLETPEGERELLVEGFREARTKKAEDRFLELYCRYRRSGEKRRLLERLQEAAFLENPLAGIGRKTARALYGRVLENSATRLELFASCAFAHFLKYGLLLKERERYEFTAADMGTVMHGALEGFAGKLEKSGLKWAELTGEQRDRLIREALEEVVRDYGNTILHSSSRSSWLIRRAESILRCTVWALQEQLKKGSFAPAGTEVAFSERNPLRSMNIALSQDERICLKGRIDRLDLCETEDRLYVRIIDYKTGKTELDLQALYWGLQLQLMVYLNAAVELEQERHPEKTAEPAGIYYFRLDDPYLKEASLDREASPEERLRAMRLNGLSRSEAEIVWLQDHTLEPGQSSGVIPVTVTGTGKLHGRSSAAPGEVFDVLRQFTARKIRELGRRILDGDTAVSPCLSGQKDSCAWCPYKGVCGFDERIPGYSRRRLPVLSGSELLERMAGEAGCLREEVGKEELQEPEGKEGGDR